MRVAHIPLIEHDVGVNSIVMHVENHVVDEPRRAHARGEREYNAAFYDVQSGKIDGVAKRRILESETRGQQCIRRGGFHSPRVSLSRFQTPPSFLQRLEKHPCLLSLAR